MHVNSHLIREFCYNILLVRKRKKERRREKRGKIGKRKRGDFTNLHSGGREGEIGEGQRDRAIERAKTPARERGTDGKRDGNGETGQSKSLVSDQQ